MAKSRFEYVKQFENHLKLLPNTFLVVRIDGHKFTSFCSSQSILKPNDKRLANLMNYSASEVMEKYRDIKLSYGQSDEFSFCIDRKSTIHSRRSEKISTNIVSLFTSAFVMGYSRFFDNPLEIVPSFDGRVVVYPTLTNLRDYLSWRQADCHINNLYNTLFWKMVQSGKSNGAVEKELMVTNSSQKNEMLFQLGINYNNEDVMFRKGSVIFREPGTVVSQSGVERVKDVVVIKHIDIIGDEFWNTQNLFTVGD